MTLNNPMEKKPLNFDQPFLSMRRGSLAGTSPEMNKKKTNNSRHEVPSLPYCISDLKSGPVSNPGAVPFQWEQTPGRPKHEKQNASETIAQLHRTPKLPPGKIFQLRHGSPSSSSRSHSKNTVLCSCGSEFEGFENVSSSDDENVIYEDARDTLSRAESFFYNCSISGVSGLDGPDMGPSGPMSDRQARDFMMGRFLPAAKAVALETPQFAPRKHFVAREQSRPATNIVTKRSPIDYNVHKELEAEEEEDDVDDFDDTKDFQAKLCGLLPRFRLLNPIPGMRDPSHLISSAQSVRVRPPYGGMRSKTVNKERRLNNLGGVKRTNKSTLTAHIAHNGNSKWKNDSSLSFLRERGYYYNSVEEVMSLVNSTSEKKMYIDYKSKIDSRDLTLSSLGSRDIHGYSRQDIELPLGPEQEARAQTQNSNIVDAWLLSSSDHRSKNDGKDLLQVSPKDQSFGLVLNTKLSKKSQVEEAGNKRSGTSLALAPLLPKSPSESWLSRTLPSMSAKQPSSKLYSGNVALKTSLVDNTRDRLLKTSNVQPLLLPPTGELATISEN